MAELTREARSDDDDVIEDLTARVQQVIAGTAAAYGVHQQTVITGRAVAISPDAQLVARSSLRRRD